MRSFLESAVSPAEKVLNWGRYCSLWYMLFGIACCAIEMMATGAARYDFDRFGMMFRASPRQADLMIVAGTVVKKMAPRVKLLYEQMAEPRYVIAMGACTISGGPFYDSYSVVRGIDQFVPVDIHIPGCPPRPEALLDGVLKLHEQIRREPYFRKWKS
ncbi:MAG: NADH-quinone oxidoreductase subunit B family protein [Armatimonadota bacterium]|nr:NADH-quinone oxidoreductase subunit B family protein [Armatimonadota bacterium]